MTPAPLMLQITPERLHFRPEFIAEMLHTWRASRRFLDNKDQKRAMAVELDDEGYSIEEITQLLMDQPRRDAVQKTGFRFWEEYRKTLDFNAKKSRAAAAKKPPKPDSTPTL